MEIFASEVLNGECLFILSASLILIPKRKHIMKCWSIFIHKTITIKKVFFIVQNQITFKVYFSHIIITQQDVVLKVCKGKNLLLLTVNYADAF